LMDQVRAGGGTQAIDTKQLFQKLVKDTLEAFLELELEEHLGYAKHDPEGHGSGNSRNGATPKRYGVISGKSALKRHAIATAASHRRSWPSAKPRWVTSQKPLSRSMRAA
jgi:transposase-like protein